MVTAISGRLAMTRFGERPPLEIWSTGGDVVGLIQSVKAPKGGSVLSAEDLGVKIPWVESRAVP